MKRSLDGPSTVVPKQAKAKKAKSAKAKTTTKKKKTAAKAKKKPKASVKKVKADTPGLTLVLFALWAALLAKEHDGGEMLMAEVMAYGVKKKKEDGWLRLNADTKHLETRCVRCNVWKEQTPENFTANHGGWEVEFERERFGKQNVCNSASTPCKECHRILRETDPKEYTRNLASPSIYRDIRKDVIADTKRRKYKIRCRFFPGIVLVFGANQEFRASIHNADNSDKWHTNWFWGCLEVNVRQDGCVIPDLMIMTMECIIRPFLIFAEMMLSAVTHAGFLEKARATAAEFKKAAVLTPKDNPKITASRGKGEDSKLYNKQLRQHHLKGIIGNRVTDNIEADIKAGRLSQDDFDKSGFGRTGDAKKAYAAACKKAAMQHFLRAGGNCGLVYSQLLTIENLATRFSADRINNDLPHYLISDKGKGREIDCSNIQWVQRALNTPGNWNHRKLVRAFLASGDREGIDISDTVRAYFVGDQRIRQAFDEIMKEEEEQKSVVSVEHMARLGWTSAFRIHHLVHFETAKGEEGMLAIMRGKGAIPTLAEQELFKNTPGLKLLWFKSDKSALESEVSDYKRAITDMIASVYTLDVK